MICALEIQQPNTKAGLQGDGGFCPGRFMNIMTYNIGFGRLNNARYSFFIDGRDVLCGAKARSDLDVVKRFSGR